MRHRGITTVGVTAREAFSLIKESVRAARIQLLMEATGAVLSEIQASAEWPAYLRGYRD